MNSPLYPWAADMLAEWKALPWISPIRYGTPACRDPSELGELVARQRAELKAITATHPDPHTRRVYRDMRADFAEVARLVRLPTSRRRHAQVGTLCGRLTDALACMTRQDTP